MKHPAVAELVRHVMTHVGADNPTELSKLLGGEWTGRDQQRKLYKWHAGQQAPNFAATIVLLRAGGLLREDAEVAAVRQDLVASRDPLATLAEVVAEIGETQKEILRRLPAPAEAPHSAPRAAPKRQRSRPA